MKGNTKCDCEPQNYSHLFPELKAVIHLIDSSPIDFFFFRIGKGTQSGQILERKIELWGFFWVINLLFLCDSNNFSCFYSLI